MDSGYPERMEDFHNETSKRLKKREKRVDFASNRE